jgi:hypothetical protein
MIRAYWITLLATIILSSFVGATENTVKVWWPQFRGPNSSGLGEGKPPVEFGPEYPSLAAMVSMCFFSASGSWMVNVLTAAFGSGSGTREESTP